MAQTTDKAPLDDESSIHIRPAPVKPPNKTKYNQNLDELQSVLAQLETAKAILIDGLRKARDVQRALRDERDRANENKSAVFQQLDQLNEEAKKKNEIVIKLRGGIPHSKQTDIDEQIRKLEYQINRNNFGRAEERRIVSEIDRLKRSKKILKEYNALKEELDKVRDRQNTLRDKRNIIFQELRELKFKEDDLRQQIKEFNTKLDENRSDIEHYREEKHQLTVKFQEQDNEYRKQQRQLKEEARRRKAEEQAIIQAEKLKELKLIEENKVPYEHEMFLCNLLIQYTQSLLTPGVSLPRSSPVNGGAGVGGGGNHHLLSLPVTQSERRRSSGFSAISDGSSHYATPMGCTPAGTPLEGSPPTSFDESSPSKASTTTTTAAAGYYKKKDDNNIFFQGVTKSGSSGGAGGGGGGKKPRGKKSHNAKKPLAHNPETIAQFVELHLFPPTQAAEIPAALDQLQGRLVFYQNKSADEMSQRRQQKQLCQQENIDDIEEGLDIGPAVPADDEVPAPSSAVQIVVDTVGDASAGSADVSFADATTIEVGQEEENVNNCKVDENVEVGGANDDGIKEVTQASDVDNVPSNLQDNIEIVNKVTKKSEEIDTINEGAVDQEDAENVDGGANPDALQQASQSDQDNAHTDSNSQSNKLTLSLNGVRHDNNTVQQENSQETDAKSKEMLSNDKKVSENGSDTLVVFKPPCESDHDGNNPNTSAITDESVTSSLPVSSLSKDEVCASPTRNGGGKLERKLLSDSFDSSGGSCDQETTGKDIHPSIV